MLIKPLILRIKLISSAVSWGFGPSCPLPSWFIAYVAVVMQVFHNLNWCFTAVNIQLIFWLKSIYDNILKNKWKKLILCKAKFTILPLFAWSPNRSAEFVARTSFACYRRDAKIPTTKSSFTCIVNYELWIKISGCLRDSFEILQTTGSLFGKKDLNI